MALSEMFACSPRAILLPMLGAIAALHPALAASKPTTPSVALALQELQRDDQRLQAIGWRLATANAPFCAGARPAVGLLLQDMMNYNDPDAIRAAVGIAGDIAVQAVAPGSPAERAGLRPDDEVLAINGSTVASLPRVKAGDYTRLTALHDRIEAALQRDGKLQLRISRTDGEAREIELTGVPACPGRFELRTQGGKAQADGARVLIGRRFGETDRPSDILEESEFAAVVAHEFAHNLLGHRDRLEEEGGNWGNVRKTEREADRLSIWLLANAGFDPAAAIRLMRGWGRRNDLGILRLPTHDGWDERAASMESEIALMQASLKQHGTADWSHDFIRE
jgi:hypothetical protein